MYYSELADHIQKFSTNVKCDETLSHFMLNIVFSGNLTWHEITPFISFVQNISDRDTFELFLIINGDSQSISLADEANVDNLKSHYDYHCDEPRDEIKVEIRVNKVLHEGTLSIYSLKFFGEYIYKEKITIFLSFFSTLFSDKWQILFEVFDDTQCFGSKTIGFMPENDAAYGIVGIIEDRKEIIKNMGDNTSVHGIDINLLPEDFYLTRRSQSERINRWFDNVCSMLSIFSIANYSTVNDSGEVQYRINGYRTVISQQKEFEEFCDCAEIAFKIYRWIYKGGDCSDKIGLARNVLSLHLNEDREIKFNNDLLNAIYSNYNIYLEKNVSDYIDIKNKITELVLESSAKVNLLCESFLDNFKKNITAFVTFFLTVVLVGGLKDNGAEAIFSPIFLWVIVVMSVISIVWLALIFCDTKAQYKYARNTIETTLGLNYKNVLVEEELSGLINPILEQSKTYIDKQIKKYTIIWIVIVFLINSGFSIGYFCLPRKTKLPKPIEHKIVDIKISSALKATPNFPLIFSSGKK